MMTLEEICKYYPNAAHMVAGHEVCASQEHWTKLREIVQSGRRSFEELCNDFPKVYRQVASDRPEVELYLHELETEDFRRYLGAKLGMM